MEHITEVTGMALEGGGVELLSARIHENQAATRQGFENAVPVSVAGLAAYASTDERAQELLGTLRRGNYPHLTPGEVIEPEAARTAESSRGLLAGIFGDRLDDIVNRLAAQSSLSRSSASMLLGMAAPLVLDAIGTEVKARNLDAHGLSRFLADEGRRASAALPDSLSGMVGGMAIGEVHSVAPSFGVREGVVEPVDVDLEARERVRRAEMEARERRLEGRSPGWWIPLAWLLGALAVVGLIVYLVSRAGREGPSVREITPEGVAPSGRLAPSEPPSAPAAEPRGRFTAPPATEPPAAESQLKAPSTAPPATEAPAAESQLKAPSTAPPATEPPAAESEPKAPSTAKPPEEEAIEAKPPQEMTPATPEGAAGELSGFLAGNDATPHRIPLTGMEFAVGSAEVPDTAMLDDVAEVLAQHPEAKIRVEGHTDPTGGQARNRSLSRERADAVKEHLVAHGVAARQIEASGKASSDPIGANDSETGRAQNRRVDLVVIER